MFDTGDTIVALATPPGEGAIAVIRLSGARAIEIAAALFRGKDLRAAATHTLHFGRIEEAGETVDEVVVSLYRRPGSYTGEDVAEISCHGSGYVIRRIIQLCIANGARLARAGEFTQRAFLNGKMDLTQAEAVADLIASQSSAAHHAAIHNLRGGFSRDLKEMREQLIQFSALIELELDFSQEDVEFADRAKFYALINRLSGVAGSLLQSFRLGNVIKNGVKVAIIGPPNAGKSTLLNALVNEERAIVSDIAGTTRDTIEEMLNIRGIMFRIIDTAGIRQHTTDIIEQRGISRSMDAMQQADVVIHLIDLTDVNTAQPVTAGGRKDVPQLYVGNKADVADLTEAKARLGELAGKTMYLSARNKDNIHQLQDALYDLVAGGAVAQEGTIITSERHYDALNDVMQALTDIRTGLDNNLPGDLLAPDIRRCLHYLGEITGMITTEDTLDYIFSKFCIGK